MQNCIAKQLQLLQSQIIAFKYNRGVVLWKNLGLSLGKEISESSLRLFMYNPYCFKGWERMSLKYLDFIQRNFFLWTRSREKILPMKKQKLLKRLLSGLKNIRFTEVVACAESFGFQLKHISGSHHIYTHRDIPEFYCNSSSTKILPWRVHCEGLSYKYFL